MLDQNILTQLKEVFQKLDKVVELRIYKSSHEKQSELVQMAQQLADTSSKIKTIEVSEDKELPTMAVAAAADDSRVFFSGIPGGHEFSSLVIAILNAAGAGKWPDESMVQRIKAIKGPSHLQTYISLSCENCPDVVQALNLMAFINPNLSHEMIDGGLCSEKIDELGIQGVPSVQLDKKTLHAGKSSLGDLLSKLEAELGVDEQALEGASKDLGLYDVVVVGAGPAGASAAIYSARKGLKVAMVGKTLGGQLKDTVGIENMISLPYTEGPKLTAQIMEHVSQYDIKVLEHRSVKSIGPTRPFLIELDSGESIEANAVVVATGAKWRELNVDGEKEYIGKGVAYCPHCDGPFYKGKDVVVVGGGNSGVEAAIDLAGIVKSVTLLEFGEELRADQVLVKKLESLENSKIIKTAQTLKVAGDGKKLNSLVYLDRKTEVEQILNIDGVFVQIGLVPNSQFLQGRVELTAHGEIVIDSKGRTSVPGIYAAGDVTNIPFKQIIISMGEGAKTALTLFEDRMKN